MSASPLSPATAPLRRLLEAWGRVAEKLADAQTREAVALVLGYEQNRIQLGPSAGSAAEAHADHCRRFGERGGLDIAALALLDPVYIAESRERLEAEIGDGERKENDK